MPYVDQLKPPFVVVELDRDAELAFFREMEEILEDSFDCLWDEAYEAWDSTGRRFALRRSPAPQHWLRRWFGVDPTPLAVDVVDERVEPEAIRARIARWIGEVLGVRPPQGRTFDEMPLGELMPLALTAEERRAQRR